MKRHRISLVNQLLITAVATFSMLLFVGFLHLVCHGD